MGENKWREVQMRNDLGLSVVLGFISGDESVDANRYEIVQYTKRFLCAVWQEGE